MKFNLSVTFSQLFILFNYEGKGIAIMANENQVVVKLKLTTEMSNVAGEALREIKGSMMWSN